MTEQYAQQRLFSLAPFSHCPEVIYEVLIIINVNNTILLSV